MKRVPAHLIMTLILGSLLLGIALSTPQAQATQDPPVVLTAQDFLDPSDPQNVLCTLPEDGSLLPCHANMLQDVLPPEDLSFVADAPCVAGTSNGTYECQNIDMLSLLPLSQIGGGSGNDMWGWTDSTTGKEYVIMGRTNGTAFIDISDPLNPVYLGNLATHAGNSIWRDVKVYRDHAYIVADYAGNHGMQIFDLTHLRNVTNPPVNFDEDGHYDRFGSAHNIVINEDTGFAYAVGISSASGTNQVGCSGGLHMIQLRHLDNPSFAGCFSSDGYTHDAQCVSYHGPDADYQGKEICMGSNTDTVTIIDVTNKGNPVEVSRTGYSGVGYTHQGWLTDDHRYFLLNDELDESASSPNARTYIWDVSDLDTPMMIGTFTANASSIDHNLYIKNGLAFLANYQTGLRVLDISDIANANVNEVGYFDIYPSGNNLNFNGAWSNYPFFESGVVAVSGIEQGLFLLRPWYRAFLGDVEAITADPDTTVTHMIPLRNVGSQDDTFQIMVEGDWGATLVSNDNFTLAAGIAMPIEVEVTIPANAQAGDSAEFTVRAYSNNAQSTTDLTASGTTIVDAVASVETPSTIQNEDGTAEAGMMVTHLVEITNHGNMPDTFQITGSESEWQTSYPASTSELALGASETIEVRVSVPEGYSDTDEVVTLDDSLTLTVTSSNDVTVSAEVVVTTTAVFHPNTHYLFLPVITK